MKHAVILAGGKGERFWPLSTSRRPKQFLSFAGDRTLLAQAVDRLDGVVPAENTWVITSEDLIDVAREAAPMLPEEHIIGEPVGRDTAAAIALGGALVRARDPEGVFCVLTADHVIGDLPRFRATLEAGLELAARHDILLTIGMPPDAPSTAYGYIEAGEPFTEAGGVEFLRAARFVEKPDEPTARTYLETGRFYWNAGMFLWSCAALESAFREHAPYLADLTNRLTDAARADRLTDALRALYPTLEKRSIDYALMEKAENVVMAKGTFPWDDVGSWPALERHLPPDDNGNAVLGRLEGHEAEGNIVYSPDRLTTLIGVRDLIVVHAGDATLICPKDRAQDVKKLVERLRADGRYDEVL